MKLELYAVERKCAKCKKYDKYGYLYTDWLTATGKEWAVFLCAKCHGDKAKTELD